jgi:hypothetical protein
VTGTLPGVAWFLPWYESVFFWLPFGAMQCWNAVRVFRRTRARRQVRADVAALLYDENHSGARAACHLARWETAVTVVTTPCDGGLAWFMARSVPGDDVLTATGWCRSESAVTRMLVRTRGQVTADYTATRPPASP